MTIMFRKLSTIINERICCVLAHGKSLYELEEKIVQLKDKDLCWIGMGQFTPSEKFILSKIDKQFDVIYDSASVSASKIEMYETNVRLPRIDEFLNRNDKKLWITTHGIIRDSIKNINQNWFLDKHINQIVIVDELFPPKEIKKWMSVPNSITLCIASLLACGASKIITFGLDGFCDEAKYIIESYYAPEWARIERTAALGSPIAHDINRDTANFRERFPNILKDYRWFFANDASILNCSPNSVHRFPQKINYTQLLEELK